MALGAGSEPQAQETKLKRKRGNAGGHLKRNGDLSIEQLPWEEVPFPERFDDAEGFFGLEEISDVEVERDESSRQVRYKLNAKTSLDEGRSRKLTKQQLNGVQKPRFGKAAEANEEEWTGIQDTEIESEASQDARVSRLKPDRKSSSHASMPSQFRALEHLNEDTNGADVSAWHSLKLSEETLSSLSRLQFSSPTPIQQSAIPQIMHGHDLIGKASTGSGKTLAFAIPIYERFLKRRDSSKYVHGEKKASPLAMIIAPTRELAHQLSDHIANLCGTATAMSLVTLTGGLSLQKQQRLLPGADIIVGTPGRIWEVMSQSSDLVQALQDLDFLVLDEADRLLSEGHFKELSEILDTLEPKGKTEGEECVDAQSQIPKAHRQTLVFSATFQKDLQRKLAGRSKHRDSTALNQQESMDYLLQKLSFRESKPKYIDVNPASQMADRLNEGILECAALEKVRIRREHRCCAYRLIRPAGPISLQSTSSSDKAAHSRFCQLYLVRTPPDAVPTKSQSTSFCIALTNATKGASSVNRAIFFSILTIINSHCHGCRCPGFGYTFCSFYRTLSCTPRSRRLRAPLWADRKSRAFGL